MARSQEIPKSDAMKAVAQTREEKRETQRKELMRQGLLKREKIMRKGMK